MNVSDPSVWSAVIALLALVLSQLPPVYRLLKGVKIRIILPEQIVLYTQLGNINVNSFLEIYNAGGRDVDITKIDCVIKNKETGKVWCFPARTYQSRQQPAQGQSPVELFIGTIRLKSGDHWSETVRFYNLFNRPKEEKAYEIINKVREDIFAKSRQLQKQQLPPQLLEADADLVQKATEFFNETFDLTDEGNYQFFVAAYDDSDDPLQVRGFDFTIFKSSVQTMKSTVVEDYKYGAGIYYSSTNPATAMYIRVTPMDVDDVRKVKTLYLKCKK